MDQVSPFDEIDSKLAAFLDSPRPVTEVHFARLCREAVRTGRKGNYPVASGILLPSSKMEFIGVNASHVPRFRSDRHAEMVCLDAFEDEGSNAEGAILLTTLEPCVMCTARLAYARLRDVCYLVPDDDGGGVTNGMAYPPSFTTNLSRITFRPFVGAPELTDVGRRLHALGEALWGTLDDD